MGGFGIFAWMFLEVTLGALATTTHWVVTENGRIQSVASFVANFFLFGAKFIFIGG